MSYANLPTNSSLKALKLELAKHLNGASTARKALEQCLGASASAVESMQAHLQRIEDALDLLNDITTSIKHLAEIATHGIAPSPNLKRDLADTTLRKMDAHNEYETATNETWKAWRQAMNGILEAGKAQKAHGDHLIVVQIISMEVDSADEMRYTETIRGVIERDDEEIARMLTGAANKDQLLLQGALKQLGEKRKKWNQLDMYLKMADQEVRGAIAKLE